MSGSCYANLMGHFGHFVAKFSNILSGFVREPHFLQGLEKRAKGVEDFICC